MSVELPAIDATQETLLADARRGDTQAFEALYRSLAPSVYGLCLRLTQNTAEAQDCTQETFIRGWRRLTEFRGESRLGTWLHRIAVNEVLGRRRRRAMEHRHLTALGFGARQVIDDPATLEDLERAIARLPERARMVFVLHSVYGHSHDEVAEMLDITPGTSKAQNFRARALLIEALPGSYDSAAGRAADNVGTAESDTTE